MSKILVFGHQNPDTDTIASAISLSYLQNQLGKETEPVALGEPNEETRFALKQFSVDPLPVVDSAGPGVEEVMLVDHNEPQQSIANLSELKVLTVVDHHRISGFVSADPLYYRAEPVGCTATILLKLYREHQVKIPSSIAGLMLSAIISDTLLFKSPTTTQEDIDAARELEELAGVELEVYGLEMLKAGTNNADKSANEIIQGDAKTFPMSDKSVRIGQVNVVDTEEVLARKGELYQEMTKISKEDRYDLVILVITDILESNSTILVHGESSTKVEQAFGKKVNDGIAVLEGVVSRKKQIVPQLTAAFEE